MKKKLFSLLTAFFMTLMLLGTPNIAEAASSSAGGCNGSHSGTKWTSTTSLPTSGNYYLNANVNLSKSTIISGNLTLCLNGHTITASNKERIFYIENGGTLTLCDCKETGKLSGSDISSNSSGVNGGGVIATSGTFTMKGGTISNGKATYGGGVYVNSSGNFTMNGGTISGNEATTNTGGGVYLNGNFKMTGGTISGNTAKTFGGGVNVSGTGSFIMNAGTISGNTAASKDGGGVYVGGTFDMIGGTISGNTAVGDGSGVNLGNTGAFTMTGGTITGNEAKGTEGGAIWFGSARVTLDGNVNITGNTKNGSANNVYMGGSNTISIGSNFSTSSKVGITTKTVPTDCMSYVDITGTTSKDVSSCFTADSGKQTVVYNSSKVQLTGEHNYSTTWSKDGTNHWHKCSVCNDQKDSAVHTWDSGKVTTAATCTATGVKTFTCTVCGQTKTETIDKIAHSYSTTWTTSDTQHWHVCTKCGTADTKSNHSWGTGKVTTAATCTATGVRTYTCTCGKTKTETINKIAHNTTHTPANAATCTAAGNSEYWYCSKCKNYFSDEACTNATTQDKVTIKATGHTEVEIPEKPATCTATGLTAGVSCSVCKTVLENPITIPALGHDYVDGICTRCHATNPIAGEKISWTIKDGTLTISGTGDMYDFTEENAPWQDKKSEITKVVIENGVTSVGDNAFSGCTNIETVSIPDTVTDIGSGAFKGTGLTEVTIPDSVNTIGDNAFADTGVKTVYYPKDTDVKENSFPNDTTQIEYSVNGDGDIIIENIISNNDTVVIPDNIGGKKVAGVDEKVQDKVSDEGHTHTGGTATCIQGAKCAVCGTVYTDTDPNNHNYVDGVCTDCGKADPDADISLTVKDGTLTISGKGTIGDISDLVGDDKDSIKNVVIGDGITSIGDNAFDGFTSLETVTIPDSVQNIGDHAFPDTVKTVYVESGAGVSDNDLPDGVTKIEYSVTDDGKVIIENISGVAEGKKVDIPDNIGGKKVAGVDEKVQDKVSDEGHTHTGGTATCTQCAKCAVCGTVYTDTDPNNHNYADGACTDCGKADPNADNNISWTVENGTLTISGTGDMNDFTEDNAPWQDKKDEITKVVIEDGVTSIGDNAFKDCTSLETVTIPDSVTDIGDNAFKGTGLKDVTIPEKVTEIGDGAFAGCDDLEKVTFEGTTPPDMGEGVFEDCDNLEQISVPEGSENAYKESEGFDGVTDNITDGTGDNGEIGGDCGDNVTWTYDEDDNTLTITGSGDMDDYGDSSETPWAEIADEIEKVVIGDGVTSIGDNAFEDCTGLTDVTIPDSVTEIGDNAFKDTGLKDVTIPENVTEIGDGAFAGCDDLEKVTFEGTTPPTMGDNVFDSNDKLEIQVPKDSEDDYKTANGFEGVADNITDGTTDNTDSCGENAKWTYDDDNKTLTITGSGDMTDWNDGSETPWADVADKIENVVIDDGITSIGDNAFEDCTNLESVVIPDTVTDIGENAIPDGVPQIEYSVNEDGDIIIENIISDGDTVVIPDKIGDRDIVGVDEKVQDKVTVEGHITHTGGTATCIALAKCAICGTEYGELGDHALNPTAAKDATCTEVGNDAYWTCSDCGKIFSDENGTTEITEVNTYPATGHTYSEAWDSDETYHWHNATCGHDIISDKEVHTWNDGVVETEPTIESEGVKIYTCEMCHATKTESIPQLAHTHTYSDKWTSGETSHWHAATCGHDVISGEAVHTEDNGRVTIPATAETEGVKTYACSVCGYVMRTESIPQLDENHAHNFSTYWIHDEMSHWHECDCGEATDISAHIENGGIVTAPPTETSTGTMTYSCIDCGYVIRTEEIPALAPVIPDHSHYFGNEWEYDPTYHWHKCECGEKSDLAEHVPSGWIVETPATTYNEGVQIKVCTVCGIELDRKSIAPVKVQDTAGTNTELVHDDELLDKVLTDEDKADINDNGSSFEVILEVTAKPTDAEQELISAALKSNEKLGMCVDLSLFKVKDGDMAAKIAVSKTNSPIGITLTIPDSIYAPDRTYFAVRVHGDKAENIGGTYDRANRTLTFYTDKFSIYAIAYTSSSVTPTIPSRPSVPSTPSTGGTTSVSPSVPVVTPTVTETTEKTEDEEISDTPYIEDVSAAAGISETDKKSQSPLYMIMIVIIIAAVGFSSIIIVKRFAKKKH